MISLSVNSQGRCDLSPVDGFQSWYPPTLRLFLVDRKVPKRWSNTGEVTPNRNAEVW